MADLEKRWPSSAGRVLRTHVEVGVVCVAAAARLLLWTPRPGWDDGSRACDRARAGDSFSFQSKPSFVASGRPVQSGGSQGGRLISRGSTLKAVVREARLPTDGSVSERGQETWQSWGNGEAPETGIVGLAQFRDGVPAKSPSFPDANLLSFTSWVIMY